MSGNRLEVEKGFYAISKYATEKWVEEKIEEAIDGIEFPEPEPEDPEDE